MLLFILGLVLFVGLVVVHEWGHFIMARRNGVDIEEFGIGFPPRLYKKRIRSPKGNFNFTINLLPLGGFVKMKGEHDDDIEPGTFGAASLKAKSKIMAAGVVMNLITAFVLLTILAAVGIPKLIDNQYTVASDTKVAHNDLIMSFVEKDSPAAKAGLQTGDVLDSIYSTHDGDAPVMGTPELTADDLPKITKQLAGEEVYVRYRHEGKAKTSQVTLRSDKEIAESKKTDNPKGYFGVGPTDFTVQRSTWSSPVVAAGLMAQFTKLTFQGLGKAVAGLGKIIAGAVTGNTTARVSGQKQASEQVSGPLGIFVILRDGSSLGINFVLLIIAIISLTLAIMNILPIPALDGGRLWLTLITRGILKKPLTQKREELINASGFLFLLALIVLITIVDIRRFF